MKIYIAHSSSFDFKSELYEPIRDSELNDQHEVILPHEDSNKLYSSKEFIKTCDLIIAEVSYASTGLGIELGWADIQDVSIVCIYKGGSKYSKALKAVTDKFIEYTNEKDLINKLTPILQT